MSELLYVYPLRSPEVLVREIGEETVVLDRKGQRVHQLNHTAAYIWQRCTGQWTVEEIAAQIANTFEVDGATARKDVAAAVQQLSAQGLVETMLRRPPPLQRTQPSLRPIGARNDGENDHTA